MPKSFLISRKRAGEQVFEDNCLGQPPSKIMSLVQSETFKNDCIAQAHSSLPFSGLSCQAVYSPDDACGQETDKNGFVKSSSHNGTGSEFKKCHSESGYCRDDHDILTHPSSSDKNLKISRRCIKRSLSFNGHHSSLHNGGETQHVYLDINNNNSNEDNDGNHSHAKYESAEDIVEVKRRLDFTYISNSCKTTNLLAPDESCRGASEISGTHYLPSKDTRHLESQSLTVYLQSRSKSDPEDNHDTLLSQERSENGCVTVAPISQEQFHYDKIKIQQRLSSSPIQEDGTCQSMVQKRDPSPGKMCALATTLHAPLPKTCASSSSDLESLENSYLNNLHDSNDLASEIVMRDISEYQGEISIGLPGTTVTSKDNHLVNADKIFQIDQKVPSCLKQSETIDSLATDEHQCHQDVVSDNKVMTLAKVGDLPSPCSPQSPSSNSSSPSSVRSSSVLRPEPWANQPDPLPSAVAATLSSSPSPSSLSTLASNHSPHFLPKCSFPTPIQKFFICDSAQTESSSPHRMYSSDEKNNSDMAITNQNHDCHPLTSLVDRSSSVFKSGDDVKSANIMKDSNPRNESPPSPEMSSMSPEINFECRGNSKEKTGKQSRALGRSFTIESIMKSENPKSENEEIQDRRVEITSSLTSSGLAQGKSYLCDKTTNLQRLVEKRGNPGAWTKDTPNRQPGEMCNNGNEVKDSAIDKVRNQSVTTRDRHRVHNILKLESSSQWNQAAVKNGMDVQRRDSEPGNPILLIPSSTTDSLGAAEDNEKANSAPQSISISFTKTHKLHRPLPLIPRPSPAFPSVLPYSPFPTDLIPATRLSHSTLQADFQSRSGISNLAINSNAPFAGKTLPLTMDPVFHKRIVDSRSLSRNPSIPLVSQNEKKNSITCRNNMSPNCFRDRHVSHPYNKSAYLPHEVLKYAQSERSNLGINQLHSSPYLAMQSFEGPARQQSSDPTANPEFYTMASYMSSADPLNKLPDHQSALSQSQSRSCTDNVEVQDDLQNSSCDAMSPLKALGITGSKSFKDFLESANVKVEFINKGHGIKNPLLNADFGESKLDLLSHASHVPCPVCHISFQSSRELQRHLKGHKEIKRFLCTFCGKGFNDTFDLKRHTRTHTGVRPYKCPQCDKAFTQRCSLESHCRKIHGVCPQLAFNQRRTKLYVCEDCGHATSTADEHFAHLRHTHAHSGEDKALT